MIANNFEIRFIPFAQLTNMQRKTKRLTSQSIPAARASLHPFRCNQCNRFFHEFWFSTRHKKKHEVQYKKFWHKKRPYLRKKSRVDELCEKMMAQQQNVLLHKLPKKKLCSDGSETYAKDGLAGKIETDLPLTRQRYNTRSQTVTKTSGVIASSLVKQVGRKRGSKPQPGGYTCKKCHKVFLQKSSLRRHEVIHSSDQPHICNICGSGFKHVKSWRRHKKEHCSKTFHQETNYKIHLKIHSRVKPFACMHCGKRFSRRNYLKAHKQLHSKEHPFRCHLCPKTFISKGHLAWHEKTHIRKTPFLCNFCSKGFYHVNNLKTHERTHTDKIYYKCEHCDKGFSKYDAFKVHESTHTGGKHKCQYCDASFALSGKLRCHEKIHSGMKGHQCRICCRSFRHGNSLKRHLKLHTGNKRFTCQKCCQVFIDVMTLKTHEKTHLKDQEKTNSCGVCRKAFQSQTKSHEVTHEIKIECQVCWIRFCTEICLETHQSKFHHPGVLAPSDQERGTKLLDTKKKRLDAGQNYPAEEVSGLCGHTHHKCLTGEPPTKERRIPKKDAAADLNQADFTQRGLSVKHLQKSKEQAGDKKDDISEESCQMSDANVETVSEKDSVPLETTDVTGRTKDKEDPEDKRDDNTEEDKNPGNLGIAKQPLVKSLGMCKIQGMVKRGKGRKRCHSQVPAKKSLTETEDDYIDGISQNQSCLLNVPSQDDLKMESDHDTNRASITISDKVTEDNIQDSKDPATIIDSDPLDLSKVSAIKETPIQSSADKSDACENVPDTKPTQQKESRKFQMPSFLGKSGCAIEEELLKFYGHAISHIGLTVYKEHENELYGRNLSQIGLYNSGCVSDTLSKEKKHL